MAIGVFQRPVLCTALTHKNGGVGTPRSPVRSLLDFARYKLWVARNQALPSAIHNEIRVFQDNPADQGRLTFWLDNGREHAVSSKKFNLHILDCIARTLILLAYRTFFSAWPTAKWPAAII
jgi:hypothetical protein